MVRAARRMYPSSSHRKILLSFLLLLTLFFTLTLINELLDAPHYLFGDARTSFAQRKGEVCIELAIYVTVVFLLFLSYRRLSLRIRILEGFIPICARCKNIREDMDWKTLEAYIEKYSLASLTHSICPDCIRILYPDIAEDILAKSHADADRDQPNRR